IENGHNNHANTVECEIAIPAYAGPGRSVLEYEDPRTEGQVQIAVRNFVIERHYENAENPARDNYRLRVPFAEE
ncbi:hypothetical protein PFISCL1PPCAC_12825, partial [Pristionchus fissidentatus]